MPEKENMSAYAKLLIFKKNICTAILSDFKLLMNQPN